MIKNQSWGWFVAQHFKRKKFLINPKFQVKFSLLVCFLVFLSSIFFPIGIYNLITNFIAYASTHCPTAGHDISKVFNEKRQLILLFLGLWQLGFTLMIFIACIIFSHKIAGPLYKLVKYFKLIQDGENPGKLFFRKGDYFPEVADEFNNAFNNLHEKHQNDFAYISEVNAYLHNLSMIVPEDKKVVLTEINKKLTDIQNRFNNT